MIAVASSFPTPGIVASRWQTGFASKMALMRLLIAASLSRERAELVAQSVKYFLR
jgi:hypothetical protein